MKIPIAKLSKDAQKATVYCDDPYIDNVFPPNFDPSNPPKYTIIGDDHLVADFNNFAKTYKETPSGHEPYSWSYACFVSHQFAERGGYKYEDIFPKELDEKVRGEYRNDILY